ncbi:MAG: SHOCT domain-containing protein [candidate division NC10 bacterium]|nr:SHOCT domain-containing protein [candidate division NC10 bacterium]
MGGPGWGGWGFGGLFMTVFWILLIVGLVLLIKWLWEQSGGKPSQGNESALDILKKRYARGEINKEEFEEKKKDLL